MEEPTYIGKNIIGTEKDAPAPPPGVMEVVHIESGEKRMIKKDRFNPEIHSVGEPKKKQEVVATAEGFPCAECDKVAKSNAGLSSHVRKTHEA